MAKTKRNTDSCHASMASRPTLSRRVFMQVAVPAASLVSSVDSLGNASPWMESDSQAPAAASETGSQRLSLSKLRSWEELGYGMFIHFGMSTFLDEIIPGRAPNSTYNPDKLDVDQWIQIARDAGMKYAVLTAKHNPGHCLWPSDYTDLTVAHSPNTTDVVEAFMKSCERRGVLPGLFYNSYDNGNLFGQVNRSAEGYYPWQERGRTTTYTTSVYQDFQTAQVTELLSRYGPAVEVWIDIPQLLGRGYRTFLYEQIARLQPSALIVMNSGKVDQAWPTDVITLERKLAPPSGHVKWREIEGKRYYVPGETCDTIGKEWFYFPGDRPRSDQELLGILLESRKRGVNLLLDVPPDRHGLIPEESRTALMRLRKNANL
jgi:alpha-L-fucosidase